MSNSDPYQLPSGNTPQRMLTSSLASSTHHYWVTITIGIGSAILLTILLFYLNYFNILSLSSLLSNQFGWLPHRPILPSAKSITTGKQSDCISEKQLRIRNSLLQNYMVNQWRGGVEGILSAYDGKSITISKEDRSITIPVSKGTYYHEKRINKETVEYATVQINSTYIGWNISGSFFVIGKDKDRNDIIEGSDFTFYKGQQKNLKS